MEVESASSDRDENGDQAKVHGMDVLERGTCHDFKYV